MLNVNQISGMAKPGAGQCFNNKAMHMAGSKLFEPSGHNKLLKVVALGLTVLHCQDLASAQTIGQLCSSSQQQFTDQLQLEADQDIVTQIAYTAPLFSALLEPPGRKKLLKVITYHMTELECLSLKSSVSG